MLIEAERISFRYRGQNCHVLKDFSFSIARGEIVGISGPSGSGKSTLLRLIAGLEQPESGWITIDGEKMADKDIFLPPEKRQVGMVFQDYGLFPHLTVEKNIAFGLSSRSKKEQRERCLEMLELTKLETFATRYPCELSGGQQQRVALARSLAPHPKLLLMDEPFSNLDAALKDNLSAQISAILKKTHITCLLVSHDQKDLENLCGRMIYVC